MPRKYRPRHGQIDHEMAKKIDRWKEFEAFEEKVAPVLKAMMDANAAPDEILRKVESMAAAMLVTEAFKSGDSQHRLKAITQILDRTQGRPTEKVETTHKFEKLKDEELDALLNSRLKEVNSEDGDSDSH